MVNMCRKRLVEGLLLSILLCPSLVRSHRVGSGSGPANTVRTAASITNSIHDGLRKFNPDKMASSSIGQFKPVVNGIKAMAPIVSGLSGAMGALGPALSIASFAMELFAEPTPSPQELLEESMELARENHQEAIDLAIDNHAESIDLAKTNHENATGLAKDNHRNATGLAKANHGEAIGLAKENHKESLEVAMVNHEETIGMAKDNHNQAMTVAMVNQKETVDLAKENHDIATGLASDNHKEALGVAENNHESATGLAKDNHRNATGLAKANHGEAIGLAKENHKEGLEVAMVNHEETIGMAKDNHNQAMTVAMVNQKETVDLAKENHDIATGLASDNHKEALGVAENNHESATGLAKDNHRNATGLAKANHGEAIGLAKENHKEALGVATKNHEDATGLAKANHVEIVGVAKHNHENATQLAQKNHAEISKLVEQQHAHEMESARRDFLQSMHRLDIGFSEMRFISDHVVSKLDQILSEIQNLPFKIRYNTLRDAIHRTTDAVLQAMNHPTFANLATIRTTCLLTPPASNFRELLRLREELQRCAATSNDPRVYRSWAYTFIGSLMETMFTKTVCDSAITEGKGLSEYHFKKEILRMKRNVTTAIHQLDVPFQALVNRDPMEYAIPDIDELLKRYTNQSMPFLPASSLTSSLFNLMSATFPEKFVAVLLWQDEEHRYLRTDPEHTRTSKSKNRTVDIEPQDHWAYEARLNGTQWKDATNSQWRLIVVMSNYTADSVDPIYVQTDRIFPLLNVTWAVASLNVPSRERYHPERVLQSRMVEVMLSFANVSAGRHVKYAAAFHPTLPHFHKSNGNLMKFYVGDLETKIDGRSYSTLKLDDKSRPYSPTTMYILPSRTWQKCRFNVRSLISGHYFLSMDELQRATSTEDKTVLRNFGLDTKPTDNCSAGLVPGIPPSFSCWYTPNS